MLSVFPAGRGTLGRRAEEHADSVDGALNRKAAQDRGPPLTALARRDAAPLRRQAGAARPSMLRRGGCRARAVDLALWSQRTAGCEAVRTKVLVS